MSSERNVASLFVDCADCAQFWGDILGDADCIDVAAVAAELHDYRVMLHEVSAVYCDLTGGLISKPNTLATHVIAAVEEHFMRRNDEES